VAPVLDRSDTEGKDVNQLFHRILLVTICVPLVFLLMVCDALACAWDEFSGDWVSAKSWFLDEWRG
jgi:hypothetical protein